MRRMLHVFPRYEHGETQSDSRTRYSEVIEDIPLAVRYVVEFGRPTVGVRFRDIEKMTRALAEIGIEFEPKNPVTHMMTDRKAGIIRDDILNEKILSAIVEFKTRLENVPAVLRRVDEVSKTLDTVVAVGVSTRCDQSGESALDAVLSEEGFEAVRGKTNLGLGHA